MISTRTRISVLFMDASQAPRTLPSPEQVPSRVAEWKPRLRNVSETHVSRVWDGNPDLAAEPKPDDVKRAWKTTRLLSQIFIFG